MQGSNPEDAYGIHLNRLSKLLILRELED
jgi:hypothetical protein